MTGPAPSTAIRWILVVELDGHPRRLELDEHEMLVGSGAGEQPVDIVLDHPTVSRRHAVLRPTAVGVEVEDLGSSNGTFVDETRIALGEEQVVGSGGRVTFGSIGGHIETIDVADTIAAVDLRRAATTEPASVDAAVPETLSMGSIRDFLATALPAVIGPLEQGTDPSGALAVVQAAGRAIFQAFPCTSVEIADRRDDAEGVLFAARHEDVVADADDAGKPTVITAGALTARIHFTPELYGPGIAPWIQLTLRLAALAWPTAPTDAPPARLEPPPLPRPEPLDRAVRQLYDEATRIARGDVSVLIGGETGTGKEVLARYLHDASPQAGSPWVALNCAALSQDLLEAELFGIERGVATGVEARAGTFEMADGGTLFLDEIGDMTATTQAKILRVLEERQVYRLGAERPRPARVRVLAATNQDLAAMVDRGTFRLDLYHRIADCRLHVPPLRQRQTDLPSLAAHFLTRAAEAAGLQVRGISRAALDVLSGYDWPGNVRQLEREMARAVLFLEDGELLQTRHLHRELVDAAAEVAPRPGETLKAQLDRVERRILIDAIERHSGNVRAAAEELGSSRTTLYRRLGELAIEI